MPEVRISGAEIAEIAVALVSVSKHHHRIRQTRRQNAAHDPLYSVQMLTCATVPGTMAMFRV
jgi:hypothetical protein